MCFVGDKIRELRLKHGLTQEQLGELLGVKKAAVQKYESGRVKNLKQNTIRKLCDIFNVPPWTFIEIQYDVKELEEEVRAIDLLGKHFGLDSVELLQNFVILNKKGRAKALDSLMDLTKITEYRED